MSHHRCVQTYFSATLRQAMISTHAKMVYQSSSENVSKVAALIHHASSNVHPITKLASRNVHAWKAAQRDVHAQTGTVMHHHLVR